MTADEWDDVAVWRAVILQMLSDLTSQNGKNSLLKHQAHQWFFSTTDRRDLTAVCELAGYHPDFIRGVARKVLERGVCSRAPVARSDKKKDFTEKEQAVPKPKRTMTDEEATKAERLTLWKQYSEQRRRQRSTDNT